MSELQQRGGGVTIIKNVLIVIGPNRAQGGEGKSQLGQCP